MGNEIQEKVKEQAKDWGMPEFVFYLYVSVARSDFQVVAEEIDEMLAKLKQLKKRHPEISENLVEQMILNQNKQSEEEVLATISYICDHNQWTELEKNRILSDLEDIIDADGIIRDLELQILDAIRRRLS